MNREQVLIYNRNDHHCDDNKGKTGISFDYGKVLYTLVTSMVMFSYRTLLKNCCIFFLL